MYKYIQMDTIQISDEKPVETAEVAPVVETMEREPVKKCCVLSPKVRSGCHYCVRCWSLSLNSVEGCCSILSAGCILLSNLAIGCNKCLEQLDCDGH